MDPVLRHEPRAVGPALAWVGGFLLIGLFLIPPIWSGAHIVYGGTDDFRMELFASGIGSAAGPSEHLFYSHILIGTALSSLYRAMPGVPWYPVYLMSVIVLSQAICAWATMRLPVNRSVRQMLSAFLFVMGLAAWTQLRFTIVAVECSLSGLFLVLLAILRDDRNERFPVGLCIAGGLLALLGGMIRFHGALLVTGILALPALCLILRHRNHIRPGPHLLIYALMLGGLWGNQKLNELWSTSDSEWKHFHDEQHDTLAAVVNTRRIRHLFMKNPEAELPSAGRTALTESGLSYNDVQTMMCWYFPDEEVLPASRVDALWSSLSSEVVLTEEGFGASAQRTVRRLAGTLEILFFLLLGGIILMVSRADMGSRVMSIVVWSISISAMFALEFLMKLPRDIAVSVGCAAVLGTTIVQAGRRPDDATAEPADPQQPRRDDSRPWQTLLVLIGLAAAAGVGWFNAKLTRKADALGAQLKHDLEPVLRDRDHLYVISLPFPFNLLPVRDDLEDWREFRFVYLDGFQRSPHARAKLKAAGIENLTEAIIRGDVKLIIHPFQIKLLRNLIAEHYADWIRTEQIQGGAIEFRQIGLGNGFEVWQTFPSDSENAASGNAVSIVKPGSEANVSSP